MNVQEIFGKLYGSKNETEIEQVINDHPDLCRNENWFPVGGNDSNYGVVENQQSNPVAALVEKLTNSIDALLMRRCLEAGIDPKSSSAPRSVEEAIECFFPDHKNWDLSPARNAQAGAIQVLADSIPGDTSDTSLIIYDDGEGQHPSEFEKTFLSLLRGNKNEIHFVQGKYNMGGSGAITFCGKHRFQLIASRRYDSSGPFGFTLIRRHPLTLQEQFTKKNTWYEYLKLDNAIPAFDINELDLRLFNRRFTTGTVIKLYSYELSGNRHIRRDLGRSLNEFLYEPALPVYLVERHERYPNDRALHGVMFGLKRQLESENEYVEETFSERIIDRAIGEVKITVHVFRTRAKGKDITETRKTIQNEYFKNNMVVLFSLHGQVHGHYTSEFVTRTLKYNLLRDYLIIHVDCTNMNIDFRNELFMASRDRLKQGEESGQLRRALADSLTSGKLGDIYRRRKSAISTEIAEDDTLLRAFAEQLPISAELRQLLSQTFKLKDIQPQPKSKATPRPDDQHRPERRTFYPKRFPTFFKLDAKLQGDGSLVLDIPLGGSRVVRFESDVENEYFDRTEDPGDLRIAVLDYVPNDVRGGNRKGTANHISDIFSVNRKSPADGTIKLVLSPTHDVCVGDEAQICVDLTNPAGEDFTQIFWVRIAKPVPKEETKGKPESEQVGVPQLIRVYERTPEEDNQDVKCWADVANIFEMGYDVVMHPLVEGDKLDAIYVNMDSTVLKRYKAGLRNPSAEQLQLADRRYVSGIYFHTLFLYAITKNLRYHLLQESENQDVDVDLTDYLKDLFRNQYTSFLLNFEVGDLIEGLG